MQPECCHEMDMVSDYKQRSMQPNLFIGRVGDVWEDDFIVKAFSYMQKPPCRFECNRLTTIIAKIFVILNCTSEKTAAVVTVPQSVQVVSLHVKTQQCCFSIT